MHYLYNVIQLNYLIFNLNTMKLTITWTSASLPDLLGVNFAILDESKSEEVAKISVQNTSALPIYLENWIHATTDGSYLIKSQEEVEMNVSNLAKLHFITDWTSLDVRIVTT